MSTSLPGPCDGAGPAARDGKAARHPALILATCILASSLAFIDGSVLNVALPAIRRSLPRRHGRGAMGDQRLHPAALGAAAARRRARRSLRAAAGDDRRASSCSPSPPCSAPPRRASPSSSPGARCRGWARRCCCRTASRPSAPPSPAKSGARRSASGRRPAPVAGAFAPMLGGWLIEGVGWPAIFLLNVPVAAAAILLGWRFVPESHNEARPDPDWPGAALATLGLGALTWGLTIWSSGAGMDPLDWAILGARRGLARRLPARRAAARRHGDGAAGDVRRRSPSSASPSSPSCSTARSAG